MRLSIRTGTVPLGAAVAAALLPAALLAAGCSPDKEGDCAWRLSYGEHTYLPPGTGLTIPDSVRHQGSPIGQGQFEGCAADRITVYEIKGASPEEAVITEDDQIGVVDPAHLPAAVQSLLSPPTAPTQPTTG